MTGRYAAACLATVLLAGPISAQRAVFGTVTEAVRVDVLVSDRGRPVSGLGSGDFELLDNGVRQDVRLVDAGELPLTVTLVLDTSQSVAGERLRHLVEACGRLLAALRASDRATVVVFDDDVQTLVSESSDIPGIRRELEKVSAGGRTSLNDAAYAGLLPRGPAEGRRLMVLFSDGADTQSWLDRDAVLRAARRAETVVYGVGLRDERASAESDTLRSLLEALPTATGGELLRAGDSRDLGGVFAKIIGEFRQRYWLAFTPTGVRQGDGWHTLSVRVKKGRVTTRHRLGYYSPTPPSAADRR